MTTAAVALVLAAEIHAHAWLEVRSPHFQVITDQGARTGRLVALDLEKIRHFLRDVLPLDATDPLRPVQVFAVEGEDSLVELLPRLAAGARPAGVFRSGPYVNHVVFRVEAGRQLIYHEYFHLLTRRHARRLPVWLTEGLAEFWSHADLSSQRAKVGQADPAAFYVLRERWLPLRTLVSQVTDPHAGDPRDVPLFYAEAWALTHLLLLGDPELAERDAIGDYMRRMRQGGDPVHAFNQAIGDIDAVDARLREYTRLFSFRYITSEFNFDLDAERFEVRDIPDAEVLALRSGLLAWGGSSDAARSLLTEARVMAPTSAAVQEATAMFDMSQERPVAAALAIDAAVAAGSQSYAVYYLRGLLMDESPETEDARLASFQRATELNPRFALAFLRQARIHSERSEHARAVALARFAVDLDPSYTSAWATLGYAFLRMERPEEARSAVAQGMEWALDDRDRLPLEALVADIDRFESYQREVERLIPAQRRHGTTRDEGPRP